MKQENQKIPIYGWTLKELNFGRWYIRHSHDPSRVKS